jgi:hypothetical protein
MGPEPLIDHRPEGLAFHEVGGSIHCSPRFQVAIKCCLKCQYGQ